MKKSILFGALMLVGFKEFKQEKQRLFKVQADITTWNKIIEVIDLSEADAKERVAVKQFIIRQLSDTALNKK